MEPLRKRFVLLWGHGFYHLSSSKACFVSVLDVHCTLVDAHTFLVCRNETAKELMCIHMLCMLLVSGVLNTFIYMFALMHSPT